MGRLVKFVGLDGWGITGVALDPSVEGSLMQYYAHSTDGPRETWESVEEHLQLCADGNNSFPGAAGFAAVFGAEQWGRLLGLWHDLGKYSPAFQRYIAECDQANLSCNRKRRRVDHSSAGAQHAVEQLGDNGKLLAYCISGHHGGLPDHLNLKNRLHKNLAEKNEAPNIKAMATMRAQEAPPAPSLDFDAKNQDRVVFQISVFCRMLFSCLVDADFLATEWFLNPAQSELRAAASAEWKQVSQIVDQSIDRLAVERPDSDVNRQRRRVLDDCRAAAPGPPGLYSLTVPTGGGKTLSSLAFATRHAAANGQRRIIYAIPFTSIIEQNADVFRDTLAPLGKDFVLEHHSNFDPKQETPFSRLASENWDAPLIVTTNVQLLESLFAAKPSRCRKLHRIARSIIILDEVQSLPVQLMEPTLWMLDELRRNYGATIVLCSATQPALNERTDFPIGLACVHEIVSNPIELSAALRRVEMEYLGTRCDEDLSERLAGHPQVLCVVNTRGHARVLFESLTRRYSGEQADSLFHLSAQMCPAHRVEQLERIRKRLDKDQPCRVVSTQLVEAGVDVDFPVVYRAMAGLDSIAQAAGRCNREGRRTRGQCYVFDEAKPPRAFSGVAADARSVLFDSAERERFAYDPLELDTMEHYFQEHLWRQKNHWDEKNIMSCLVRRGAKFNFQMAADRYRLIENEQTPVVIPYGNAGAAIAAAILELDQDQSLDASSQAQRRRSLQRKAQRFSVGIYSWQLQQLQHAGSIRTVAESFHVLHPGAVSRCYRPDVGLVCGEEGTDAEMWIV